MRSTPTCVAALLVLAAGGLSAADRLPSDPPKDWKYCQPWTLTTIAGVAQTNTINADGQMFWASTGDEGPASSAKIGNCSGIAVGPDGTIYFCATLSHAVRKITPDGIVHHVAGVYDQKADYGDAASIGDGGSALSAHLDHPFSLAVDGSGNLYILDYARLRKVTPGGVISTVAGSTFQPPFTQTSADLTAAETDFRFNGPATQTRLWTAFGDMWLGGSLAVAHDGTIYLHTDLGIRRIASGTISPVIEGGYWQWFPSASVGSYRFLDIALDSHDALYATGGPNVTGLVGATAAPDIYRVAATGVVTRVLGSDDSKGFFTDPEGWNVGPNSAGKSFSIQGLRFDASDRMWFQPPVDGPHFCHLDADGVIRWSGAFQTHSTAVSDASGEPAPLNFAQNGPMTRSYDRLPGGGWALTQFAHDGGGANGYPVIRTLKAIAPSKAPVLSLAGTSVAVTAALGTTGTPVHDIATNTGTMFGELGFTSDQPWLRTFQPAETFVTGSGSLPFAAGAHQDIADGVTVAPLPNMAPGDYTGHVYVHLLGTGAAPQVVTVTMHVTAGAGGNLTPVITIPQQFYRIAEDGVLTVPLSAVDDGLPSPPHALSWSFKQLPVHGTATIANGVLTYTPPHNFNTMGSPDVFHSDEQLAVQVSDGALSTWLGLDIHVDSINDQSTVDAGADQAVTLPASAALHGTVADTDVICDATGALVPQPVQPRWSKVSGPGTVTFSDPAALDATADFSAPGTYVLSLTANDAVASVFDTVTITVAGGGSTTTTGGSSTGSASTGGTTTGSSQPIAGSQDSGKGCGLGSGLALAGLLGLMGIGRRRR